MDIVITGRHVAVSDRFRALADEKLAKIAQLAPSANRVDVEVSQERHSRQSPTCKKVEITVRDRGPVIRAEAVADDPYSALDLAMGKLLERLRRSRDRRKVHHGRHTPDSVRRGAAVTPGALAPASLVEPDGAPAASAPAGDDGELYEMDGPVVIRTKDHEAVPMSIDQALYEMEMVGHDFYLFLDAESGRPSVVYRRRGWNYGLIRLRAEVAEVTEPGARGSALDGAAPSGTSAAMDAGSTLNGSALNGSTLNGSALNGSTDGAAANGSTMNGHDLPSDRLVGTRR